MFAAHRPTGELASSVEVLWYFDGYTSAAHQERVIPTDRFQVVIDLTFGPGVVVGLRSQYIALDTAPIRSVMGIVFRPGRARAFFDPPADAFFNQVVTLDLVWGAGINSLRDRVSEAPTVAARFHVIEDALRDRAHARRTCHPAVRYALDEFQRAPHIQRVLDVTRDAGLSRRRLSELFREQVGLTPKLYCRVRRFQRVVRQIATGAQVDWAEVACAGGYADQAHLSHEFREFSGLSPAVFLSHDRFGNHVRLD